MAARKPKAVKTAQPAATKYVPLPPHASKAALQTKWPTQPPIVK